MKCASFQGNTAFKLTFDSVHGEGRVAPRLAVALVVGSVWLVCAPTKEHAWTLFKFTSPYLALLFLLLALNAIVIG